MRTRTSRQYSAQAAQSVVLSPEAFPAPNSHPIPHWPLRGASGKMKCPRGLGVFPDRAGESADLRQATSSQSSGQDRVPQSCASGPRTCQRLACRRCAARELPALPLAGTPRSAVRCSPSVRCAPLRDCKLSGQGRRVFVAPEARASNRPTQVTVQHAQPAKAPLATGF
jgi:hypothetical protein